LIRLSAFDGFSASSLPEELKAQLSRAEANLRRLSPHAVFAAQIFRTCVARLERTRLAIFYVRLECAIDQSVGPSARFQFRSYLEKHFREPGSGPIWLIPILQRDGVAQQKHNDAFGADGGLASHLQAGAVGKCVELLL